MRRQWRVLATLGCLAGLAATPASAFKIETHLWVGQQVINDLADDGMISVNLGGQQVRLPVRADIQTAILQNKNEYLLGHLGPDAMPDVVVGQSIMHPGGFGWKANDWAKYMLQAAGTNAVGKAFAYGYLGHGAADVFAHTYVNQYAGDHFDLTNELLVEERHIALEGYIAKATPPLVSSTGVYLGKGYQTVRTSDALAAHLRDTLIYSADAQSQYRLETFAPHLIAFKGYRTALDTAAETDVWRRLDTAIVRYVAAQYGLSLSSAQAGQALDLVASINGKVNQGINVTQQELTDLNNRINALDLRFAQGAQSALNRVVALESSLISAQADLEARLIESACEQVDNVCRITIPDVCWKWYGPVPCTRTITDPVCAATFRATCRSLTQLNALRTDAALALSNQRTRISAELVSLQTELAQARASSLQMANALVDLLQIPTQGSSPMQAVLRNWRSDADLIFADYVKAATQAMINTTNPSVSAISPMQAWLDCNGPALMGVPLVVSGCTTRTSAMQLFNTLNRLANLPADSLAVSIGLPTSTELLALKAKLVAEVTDKVKEEVTRGLIRLLPEKYQGILQVLDEDITADRLRYYFTKPDLSGLNLLPIADIDLRVNREMNLGNTVFDATRFAAIANAVTLAKLALLDNAGLLQLAALAGVPTKSNGAVTFAGIDNIMADAFVSFDGNHQWLEAAPPRPRSAGPFDPPLLNKPGKLQYPYATGYRSAAGFEPWHPDLRTKLFRALFVGPLSPGLENPAEIGATPLLLDAYPYRPCRSNAFPDAWNAGCTAGQLQVWVAPPPPPAPPAPPPPPPRIPPGCGTNGRICP